jgi:oxygen-independent coproporphyrinogen-3 oxidase
VQRDLFLEASRFLTESGFIHYEVSNFASSEACFSRHNVRYWLRGEYVGVGPSAHSFDGRTRRWNHRSVEGWLEAVEAGEPPFEGEETLSEAQVRLERLMLGFRTVRGVEISLLREHPDWEATLSDLLARSLVTIEGDHAVPTAEGFLLADRLPVLFM